MTPTIKNILRLIFWGLACIFECVSFYKNWKSGSFQEQKLSWKIWDVAGVIIFTYMFIDSITCFYDD